MEKKTANSSRKTRPKATRKVVDPMMVSRKKAREDDDSLRNRAELNRQGYIDEEEDSWSLSDEELMEEELPLLKKEKKPKKGKKAKNSKKDKKRKTPVWAKVLITILVLIILAIVAAGAYFYFVASKATSVFEGNPMDLLVGTPLAEDEYGRTNILIFGTAEDEAGHDGAELTDSILVVSLDQDKKIGATFSVPRDLWVNYTVPGEDALYCPVGYKGKINATYYCAKLNNDGDKEKGAIYFSKKITEVTGLNIQYYMAVDFSVLRDLTDTLGGLDVDVHSTDDRGIYDANFDLELKKGMNYNLDGDTVLKLARARNAKGGYGLANSNFDREINQQHIINAMRQKALSAGILANPSKVIGMIDDLGNNVRTNISMAEMRTLIDFANGMNGDLTSIETQKMFSTGTIGSQSVVIPAGASVDYESSIYNYTKLQKYLRSEIDKTGASSENGADSSSDSDSDGTGSKKSGASSKSSSKTSSYNSEE